VAEQELDLFDIPPFFRQRSASTHRPSRNWMVSTSSTASSGVSPTVREDCGSQRSC